MKAAFAIVFLTVLLTLSMGQQQSHGSGQPLCNDAYEFTRFWRNNWDPNSYFQCEYQGVAASIYRCHAQAFIESQQDCGEWENWLWQTPFDPPYHN